MAGNAKDMLDLQRAGMSFPGDSCQMIYGTV
jgi:hypothetical protein